MSLRFPPRPFLLLAGVLSWASGWSAFVSAQIPDTLRYSFYAPKTLPQTLEQQGYAVALSGTTAVVGSPYYDEDPVSRPDCGVVKIYDTANGNLLHRFASPGGAPFGYFGEAVAISGSKVVVASGEPVGEHSYAGNVYVYDLNSPTPSVPVVSIPNPAPSEQGQFGHSVAIDGDLLVVGAWMDDASGVNSGRAYVYDLAGSSPDEPLLALENPSPAENDNFGVSVAISSSKVAVSAYHDNTGNPNAGRVYIYDLEGQIPAVPVLSLGKPGADRNDCFGSALSMSGPLLAVGSELSDADALNSGNVYVFNLDSGTPGQPVHSLANPVPQDHGYFGTSVSISGTFLTVGAYRNDGAVVNGGACYVFDLAGSTPTVPLLSLSKPSWDEDDSLGNSVAMAGNKILAGAWRDDTGELDSGISYVYDLDAEIPASPVMVLDSPRRDSVDRFGTAVAIAGDLVAVGSPDSDSGSTRAGRVSIHDLASSKPSATLAFLENPNPAINDAFGSAVAISDTWIIVGAPGDDTGAANSGCVYVYDFSEGVPESPMLVIPNPSPEAGEAFGAVIAASGSRIAVGVALDDTGAADSGCVHLYDLASPDPASPVATILNPDPVADDRFGAAVALSSSGLLVGAPKDDSGASNSGTAYYYDLSTSIPAIPSLTFPNPGPAADDGFGGSVAIFGNRIAVGAESDDTGATDTGSVYVFDLLAPAPAIPFATLNNPNPGSDDRFGHAIAASGDRVAVGAHLDNSPTDSGRVYTFNMASPTSGVPSATLAKSTPGNGDLFGSSVAISGVIVVVGVPSDNRTATDKGAAYVFGPAAPEIAVEGPTGEELMSGDSADFGAVAIGQGGGGALGFTILNTGITGLPVTGITVVGGDAQDFSVNTQGMSSTVPADDDTSFTVTLTPTAAGLRSTTLRIQNGDSNENPFDIQLSGIGLSEADDTDADGLNDVAELRMAGLGFDWQVPDAELSATFHATSAPAGFFAPDRVQALNIVGPEISQDPASGHLKLKMFLEKSTDFTHYTPFPMTLPETSINPEGELEFRFSVPGDPAFFRLETD